MCSEASLEMSPEADAPTQWTVLADRTPEKSRFSPLSSCSMRNRAELYAPNKSENKHNPHPRALANPPWGLTGGGGGPPPLSEKTGLLTRIKTERVESCAFLTGLVKKRLSWSSPPSTQSFSQGGGRRGFLGVSASF